MSAFNAAQLEDFCELWHRVFKPLHWKPDTQPTPDQVHELEERLAIQQEGCGLPIDEVRRDVVTGIEIKTEVEK